MDELDRKVIKDLMFRLEPPVECSCMNTKKGQHCSVHEKGVETICCYYCFSFLKCLKRWNNKEKMHPDDRYTCRRYKTVRWCSAAKKAYEDRHI